MKPNPQQIAGSDFYKIGIRKWDVRGDIHIEFTSQYTESKHPNEIRNNFSLTLTKQQYETMVQYLTQENP